MAPNPPPKKTEIKILTGSILLNEQLIHSDRLEKTYFFDYRLFCNQWDNLIHLVQIFQETHSQFACPVPKFSLPNCFR